MTYRRVPVAPLLQATGAPNNLQAARTLGVQPRQIYRWRRYGLKLNDSDRMAAQLGKHPTEIWEGWPQVECGAYAYRMGWCACQVCTAANTARGQRRRATA